MARHLADPNFGTAASDKHVPDYIGSWSDHVLSWTIPPHPKIHVVRYEDLHAAPEAEYSRLVGFLGLSPSREQLGRAVRFSLFDMLSSQEQRAGFRERTAVAQAFFRRGRPGEGRERLSAALIDAIVSAHSEQMTRFGYLP
jgi:hypothetical protein